MNLYNESVFLETKKLLKELIQIPSITGNEKAICEFIIEKMEEFGIDEASLQYVQENRYNVVGRLKGGKPGKTILLTGHIDVVSPGEGWTKEPFEATEEGGRIYGRGANDMKAGIAIILECIKIAAQNRENFHGNLEIAFLCDEEAYSEGAITFVKNSVQADFGLAAEPEFEMIEIGAVGKVLISVLVEGKSCHGATPQLGINAIEEAAEFIVGLKQVKTPAHAKISSQPYVLLKARCGTDEYSIVVPDKCELLINKHTIPGESVEDVIRTLEQVVIDLGLKAKFTFTIQKPFYPSFEVSEDNEDLVRLKKIIKEVTGNDALVGYGNGVCDSNYLVPKGNIPTVCYGPAGGNMHAADEWVDIEKIKTVLKVYLEFLFSDKGE